MNKCQILIASEPGQLNLRKQDAEPISNIFTLLIHYYSYQFELGFTLLEIWNEDGGF